MILNIQLLEKKKRVQLKDMGEDLECLCQIMRTVGPRLDHAKAKVSVVRIESGLHSHGSFLSVQGWRVYM